MNANAKIGFLNQNGDHVQGFQDVYLIYQGTVGILRRHCAGVYSPVNIHGAKILLLLLFFFKLVGSEGLKGRVKRNNSAFSLHLASLCLHYFPCYTIIELFHGPLIYNLLSK